MRAVLSVDYFLVLSHDWLVSNLLWLTNVGERGVPISSRRSRHFEDMSMLLIHIMCIKVYRCMCIVRYMRAALHRLAVRIIQLGNGFMSEWAIIWLFVACLWSASVVVVSMVAVVGRRPSPSRWRRHQAGNIRAMSIQEQRLFVSSKTLKSPCTHWSW